MKKEYFMIATKADKGCSRIGTSGRLDFPCHGTKVSFLQNIVCIPSLKEDMYRYLSLIASSVVMGK